MSTADTTPHKFAPSERCSVTCRRCGNGPEWPMHGADPLSIACPRCEARPRFQCHAISDTGHWAALTHRARWKAIGIVNPTAEQKGVAWQIARQHHKDLMREFSDRRSARTSAQQSGATDV